MASFEEIDGARRLLGLSEAATLREIKQAYRRMVKKYHPDVARGIDGADEKTSELNHAFRILSDYCASYRFCFTEQDVRRTYPEEQVTERYAQGWFDGP
jgi:preprotein translocase subunit Sec63